MYGISAVLRVKLNALTRCDPTARTCKNSPIASRYARQSEVVNGNQASKLAHIHALCIDPTGLK